MTLASIFSMAMGKTAIAGGLDVVPPRPIAAEPAIDWTGPYVGLSLGGVFSEGLAERSLASGAVIETDVANGLFPDDIGDTQSAAFGGVSLGYNVQRGNFVSGLEFSLSKMNQDVDFGFSRVDPEILVGVDTITRYGTEIDNLATLSLRAGYAMDKNLFYATAGIARAGVENRFTLDLTGANIPRLDFEEDDTRWGYTVGLGVERRVTDRVSVTGQVSYYDLQNATVEARAPGIFPGNALDYTFDNSGFVAKIGLNLAF